MTTTSTSSGRAGTGAAATGLRLAVATAAVSGVAVWANGHAVGRFPDATTATTAKNLVAAAVLVAALAVAGRRRAAPTRWWADAPRRVRLGVLAVAVVGGSVPFVLFFEGLARAEAADAALLHKTLVVWVAVLGVTLLGERLSALHVVAVGALLAGQAALAVDPASLRPGTGEWLVLVATWLWAVETVLARRLLADVPAPALGAARLGLGVVLLLAWAAARGELATLAGLSADQWAWAVLTGAILAGYVTCWYGALARAAAVDVTALLVPAVLLTTALQVVVDGRALDGRVPGLALLAAGGALAALAAARRGAPRRAAPGRLAGAER
jgi:drug/metabolite transporter (DMT)-like permease